MDQTRYERGLKMRRAVLGVDHVDSEEIGRDRLNGPAM
ncbi:hypothetical protein GGQ99_002554 [Aminobacter niigataensis]|uniref:4-carboxymuconolactone decarboxylase n=1 Tax=Aminobacter niigataensis TaxID=83265 RepID=A0ABR6L1Y1_9HYPH|nr:hypothetical protein [Aminobacter niigataensis]